MYDPSKYVLCETDFTELDSSVQVHQKGLNTPVSIGAERNMEVDSSVLVHHGCRRVHTVFKIFFFMTFHDFLGQKTYHFS